MEEGRNKEGIKEKKERNEGERENLKKINNNRKPLWESVPY